MEHSCSLTLLSVKGLMAGLVIFVLVDCANLPCISGRSQFTDAKVTKHITKISKSAAADLTRVSEAVCRVTSLSILSDGGTDGRSNGFN